MRSSLRTGAPFLPPPHLSRSSLQLWISGAPGCLPGDLCEAGTSKNCRGSTWPPSHPSQKFGYKTEPPAIHCHGSAGGGCVFCLGPILVRLRSRYDVEHRQQEVPPCAVKALPTAWKAAARRRSALSTAGRHREHRKQEVPLYWVQ